jgi:serralysin
MPTPQTSSPVSFNSALAKDPWVEAMLMDYKWGGPTGTGTTLTFSFPTAPALPGLWSTASEQVGGYGVSGTAKTEPYYPTFAALNPGQQANAAKALQAWSDVANVKFQLVAESQQEVGDIRFAVTDVDDVLGSTSSAAFTKEPWPNRPNSADIWLNLPIRGPESLTNPTPGNGGYVTLLHEIGHALGLKHPFEGVYQLPDEVERFAYTVMSYSRSMGELDLEGKSSIYPTTPMVIDILAMQYLYGENKTHRTGNDTYTFKEGVDYYQTIWDAGGIDTLVWEGTTGRTLDLRGGNFSNLGNPVTLIPGVTQNETVAIAYKTVIEDARGGSGNDILIGNSVANVLWGNGGADTIYSAEGDDTIVGGAGHDRAIMDGKLAAHKITDYGFYGLHSHGPEDVEELFEIEVLDFTDGVVTIADNDPLFDTIFYLQQHADVFQSGINPRAYYRGDGWRLGDDPNEFFDVDGYLAAYADIRAAKIEPLEHYRTFGWKEGRDPSTAFDTVSYLSAYADVRASGMNPLEHFLTFGRGEGRSAFGDGDWI